MKTGLFAGISNAAYHGGDGISKSGLDLIARSPLHYFAKYRSPDRERDEPTDAMKLGTAVHSAVLEPGSFASDYIVVPSDAPRRPTTVQLNAKKPSDDTVIAIEWWDVFNSVNSDKTILSVSDMTACMALQSSARSHPAASVLLGSGVAEQSAFWTDTETGALCKCRPDWLNNDAGVIVDVKTTEDASPEGFAKSILNYGYHMQAAWYLDGVEIATGKRPKAFVFLAMEKKRPYATAAYYADAEMIEAGRQKYRALLDVYAQCNVANVWPGYPRELQKISLPDWYVRKIEAANDNQR